MTHHIMASRPRVVRNFNLAKLRGAGGKTSVLQPGMGDPDWVNEVWLRRYRSELPPGTIVKLPDGSTFSIEPKG